eukprot:189233-Pelagomonas_calceolata.AAC.10
MAIKSSKVTTVNMALRLLGLAPGHGLGLPSMLALQLGLELGAALGLRLGLELGLGLEVGLEMEVALGLSSTGTGTET